MTKFETAIIAKDKEQIRKIVKEWTDKNLKEYLSQFDALDDFWSKAEITKQRGFYVDYNEKLLSPEQFNKEDYLKILEITQSFNDDCKDLIELIKSASDEEKEQALREINKNDEFYEEFENFIN